MTRGRCGSLYHIRMTFAFTTPRRFNRRTRRKAMKRFTRFALVWFAVCFALAPLRAQEAPKKAPGPAPSPSEAVLEAWNDIGRKLIAMPRDFPEDKFSFT